MSKERDFFFCPRYGKPERCTVVKELQAKLDAYEDAEKFVADPPHEEASK